MKSTLSLAFVFVIGGIIFPCHAETHYATGVSAEGGWFDCNKAYNPEAFSYVENGLKPNTTALANYFPHTDEYMCWAASSSNILEYMNAQKGNATVYSSSYNTSSGNSKVDAILRSRAQYESYYKFLEYCNDDGGNAVDGICWYATGDEAYNYGSGTALSYKDSLNMGGGYFQDIVGSDGATFRNQYVSTFYQFYGYGYAGDYQLNNILTNATSYTNLFSQSLASGPIALSINTMDEGNNFMNGHAITCWGYETDANGVISSIFITDSDDGMEILRTLTVSQNANGYLTLSENETYQSFYYDENGDSTGYYGNISYADDGYVLTSLASFNNFYPVLVPEPSTVSLSLLGLAGLLLRRKKD